ncbi:DNA polymerase III subunit delta' C-terminal domain-containing protein [Buchnera aphidicola]|uniref:DNA polymerase III subunit delta' C-terminal domain-containing protein n=1 Tax=Buchnera aphidicola TaxID=9 RepID=UPI0034639455
MYATSLKICDYSPIQAEKLFSQLLWEKRLNFYNQLENSIKTNNMIKLLVYFNHDHKKIIFWICSLLLDVIKWKHKLYTLITNIDKVELITQLSQINSFKYLNKSIQSWIKCRYKLITINGINHELIIVEQLLYWQYISNTFN